MEMACCGNENLRQSSLSEYWAGADAIQRSSAIKLAELRRQFVKFVPELLCMQG